MRVPHAVWVSALSIRIRTICATRTGSHTASIPPGPTRSSRCESCWASDGSNSPDTDRVSSPRSTCSGRSSSDPDSRRDRSSRSTESFRSRSTWPRTCSRNRGRVSGSRSASSSSSTNPPSEKIGVRSSCDAVAMNFLRADSSCESWRCIWLNATASCPSSSLESTGIGCPKSPAATCSAASSRRLTRCASARAISQLPTSASNSAIPPATRIWWRTVATVRTMSEAGAEYTITAATRPWNKTGLAASATVAGTRAPRCR